MLLNALEIALPNNQLPIRERSFVIDQSVQQQTVIALKGPGKNEPLTLRSPSGVLITPDTDLPGIEYEDTAGYQLYQIDSPELGIWEIVTSDVNRVFVDSDFSVRLIEFPSTLEQGQPVNVAVEVLIADEPVKSDSWPANLQVQLKIDQGAWIDLEADSDVFSTRLPDLSVGNYELTLVARAANLERQVQRSLSIIGVQTAAALGDGETQAVIQFKAEELVEDPPVPLPEDQPRQEPETPAVAEVILESGLTLTQWLLMIGALFLVIVIAAAFLLTKSEKR